MMRHLALLSILALVACKGDDGDTDEEFVVDLGDPPEDLFIPDVDDLNLVATFKEALAVASTVHMSSAWQGHVQSLDLVKPGCPDLYAGVPDIDNVDIDADEDAEGVTWSDNCETPGGLYFRGFNFWDSDILIDDSVDGLVTTTATREISADAIVGDLAGVRFEFDGTGSDSLNRTDQDLDGDPTTKDDNVVNWNYSSLIEGTVTGAAAFQGSATPGGWRTDLNLSIIGGDEEQLTARGNVFLFDSLLADRFDSMVFEIFYQGKQGAGPDECTKEPYGYIGLRDQNAFWYDLVFLPNEEEDITGPGYANDPLSECDGCGNLYIRGVEVDMEVCPNFSSIFDDFTPPDVQEYVLSLREIPE